MVISTGSEVQVAHQSVLPGRRPAAWITASGIAVLAAAWWLREPVVPYLLLCGLATVAALSLAVATGPDGRGGRAWRLAFAMTAVLFCVAGSASQRALRRIDTRWGEYSGAATARGTDALRDALAATAVELQAAAAEALAAPADPEAAFRTLAEIADRGPERGVVVLRSGRPAAWAGRVRVSPAAPGAPLVVTFSPFYITMHAFAERDGVRAVVSTLLDAAPPADRISKPLTARVASQSGVRAFELSPPSAILPPGSFLFAAGGQPLLRARTAPLDRGEWRLHALERARATGSLVLAAMALLFLATIWPRPATLPTRLLSLGVPLAAVAVVPLNTFSSHTRLFDPSFFFASLGGPFTASVGALGLTSGLILLGLLAVLRSRGIAMSRPAALLLVLAIAGLAPFLLRRLARGIAPPALGVPVSLWLAWEVAIFLAAVAILVAGASAGRIALGAHRGLPPTLAPVMAGAAALLGPLLWSAPGRWPDWYTGLWIAAVGALALTRATRALLLSAAIVAGFGAATLVWSAEARARVQLAGRDVAGLGVADPQAEALVERFGAQLARGAPPVTRAQLLQRYVESDLAAAGFPVQLGAWTAAGPAVAELSMSAAEPRPADLASAVADARGGRFVLQPLDGTAGVRLAMAVPHSGGSVTTVVVTPRTRMVPDDPFAALLGLTATRAEEPAYLLTLTGVDSAPPPSGEGRWRREGATLHGHFAVGTPSEPALAHVEVELRSIDTLIQRGTLVVLLDVAIVAALWLLSALADGGVGRWTRLRQRDWVNSYRARLTLALFAFFVIPAGAFALWSYQRLKNDDRQSRELLVRETLRAVAARNDFARLAEEGDRLDTPLLLYGGGELRATSDTLYAELAPLGLYLRPDVYLAVALSDDLTSSRLERIGRTPALFGYRAATEPSGARVVLAAPARTDELALDRRRRDLGVLVLFATALGALAALWLSGIAARQLARPIGTLREAALAIASGDREPALPGEPPSEFAPVFAGFRTMASDLSASRAAFEDAQRRIAAVLRNVASGVIAVDAAGVVSLANPRADALLGAALPPGTSLDDAGATPLADRVRAFVQGAEDDEEFDLELGARQLHARLTRLARSGGGAVLTLDDVTELARAQRVLAWGEMARQVAHEIKNPLTPIRLGVQHLRRARADGRVDFDAVLEQNVGRILAEIDRLDEIARAFSRYGTAPAERPAGESIDVAAIARDVLELERMGESSVAWLVTGADDPASAIARADELREVLLNLLENARLAGARTVHVRVERRPEATCISVEDDGEGIPAEVLPRIFEPHFSTRTSGSGLGLAISRRIVDSWGGEITVRSERGAGTTVEVRLAR